MKHKETVDFYKVDLNTNISLPYYKFGLYAGFESPASNYIASSIDLNMALLLDSENSRIFKVIDNDLEGENIFKGDYAIIDTTLKPGHENKISCNLYGEDINRILTIRDKNNITLSATDQRIPIQRLSHELPLTVNGVITYTITPHVYCNLLPNGQQEKTVDLNKFLIRRKSSTFLGLIQGNSMKDAKIFDNDLAIIDRSLPYVTGCKALCRIEEMFTIKYLEWQGETLWLKPANSQIPPLKVTEDQTVEVWGVVAYTITSHLRKFH